MAWPVRAYGAYDLSRRALGRRRGGWGGAVPFRGPKSWKKCGSIPGALSIGPIYILRALTCGFCLHAWSPGLCAAAYSLSMLNAFMSYVRIPGYDGNVARDPAQVASQTICDGTGSSDLLSNEQKWLGSIMLRRRMRSWQPHVAALRSVRGAVSRRTAQPFGLVTVLSTSCPGTWCPSTCARCSVCGGPKACR